MARRRADLLLVERGFFASRAKAQEAIVAGLVSADGRVIAKPSEEIAETAEIDATAPYPWVSRGGVKLEAALDAFDIDVHGAVCLDLGASTGGFSEVLLARGAKKIYAVDVGRGQLHPRLRSERRIVALEGQDARRLTAQDLDTPPDVITCDVSFISLTLVLPNALALAKHAVRVVCLIKPQFEAGPRDVKKGLVKDPRVQTRVCAEIRAFLEARQCRITGFRPSPITGGDGNQEFLIAAERG